MSSSGSGPSDIAGFLGLLGLLLIALKLTGVIDWSWWWVTAPLWVGALLALTLIAFVIGAAVLIAIVTRD
ncbi:hypothetical protein Q8791_23245 [Nocardiopsis sp. CT-R113]|uniref:Transmembrane Fragile-X-F protein n=1 Tax=Nocardiopsis codii TaxID=3065942 RepID=A0ABU7KD24_9ACTN|nr:hypothetical protein [Nocardiopsis sp. CT-R113]MEE2040138.1 hypothetical protein [Nocardiopsis sp. CT-R113]